MEIVSTEYKEQMRKPIRNHSYVKISYGLFNLQAEEQAVISASEQEPFSMTELKDDILPEYSYATFETDRMKVGSGQIILPDSDYKYQGFVSSVLSDQNGVFQEQPTIEIQFDYPQDMYGVTLLFDPVEGYFPKKISVNDVEYLVDSNEFIAGERIIGADRITIKFLETYKPFWRARLAQIQFGQNVVFDNMKIVDVTLQTKVDLVSGELSYKKLTARVTNYDQAYNPLNPQGLSEFLDERQPIKLEYGYELDSGNVEWVLGDNLVMEGIPKTGDYDFTFTAVDNLSNLTGTYYKGEFYKGGISLYDLAVKVLQDAEVEDYVLDERLKTITTTGALPVISHRECLQIIANAGQSVLFTNRLGQIQIKTALDPIVTVSDNNHIYYSDAESAYNDTELPTTKYAEYLPDSMRVGQKNKIIIPDSGSPLNRRGYISEVYGNENGEFTEILPTYIIKYSFAYSIFSIPVIFDSIDHEYAVDFDVVYKLGDEQVDIFEVRGNDQVEYTIEHDAFNMDSVEIVIRKWSKPFHRAVIDQIGGGRVNDMRIDFFTSYRRPVVQKRELTKKVSVQSYGYSLSEEASVVSKQKIIVEGVTKFQLQHEGANNIVATVSESANILSEEHYAYVSVITVEGNGEYELTLTGNKIVISTITISNDLNPRGIEQPPITNPLMTNTSIAKLQAAWIGDFYNKRNKLTTEYRGNPEIDAYDVLYVESQFEPLFPARVSDTKLVFNGSLSGSLTVLKV